jgi:type IV secretory pathway TraG/TraD family ATPase VirD4
MVVAQSMASLDRIYGPVTRKDMLNNFLYKVVLQSGDADTQLEIAKMLGHKKEKQTSKTSGSGSSSFTEREELVWAIEPEDLGKLDGDLILIHPAGFERLRKTPYYDYE